MIVIASISKNLQVTCVNVDDWSGGVEGRREGEGRGGEGQEGSGGGGRGENIHRILPLGSTSIGH